MNETMIRCLLWCLTAVSGVVCATEESAGWLVRVSANAPVPDSHAISLMQFADHSELVWLPTLDAVWLAAGLQSGGVHYAVPNEALVLPKTPAPEWTLLNTAADSQDFLANDGFDSLLTTQRDCSGALVSVLDSGLDMTHERLQGVSLESPFDAITATEGVTDGFGHGTHVAGLIASSDNGQWGGACTNARLMPIRFLNAYGGGRIADAVTGIEWALAHDARIINHSWTVLSTNSALLDALLKADEAGVLQVFAAGNLATDQDRVPVYPAGYVEQLNGALSVANWDADTAGLYNTSNYGIRSVDLAASGTRLLSLAPNNGESIRTGTSMAAPVVAAAAAMLITADPTASPTEVRARLLAGCDPQPALLNKTRCGGRLNAQASLDADAIAVFRHQEYESTVVLEGEGLNRITTWSYRSWLDGNVQSVQPLEQSAQRVEWERPPVPGEWIWSTADNREQRYPYQAPLAAPTALALTVTAEDLLLAWNGVEGADTYRIEADINFSGFETVAEVADPISQWRMTAANDLVRLRVVASRTYWLAGVENGTAITTTSSSDVVTAGADTALWQTVRFADIPQGANARLPVHLLDGANTDALQLSDSANGAVDLDTGGVLVPDTSAAASFVVPLLYADADTGLSSQRDLSLEVVAGESWSLLLDNGDRLLVDTDRLEVQAVSLDLDGSVQLALVDAEGDGVVSVRLQTADHRITSVQLTAASAAATMRLSSDQQTVYLTPAAAVAVQTLGLRFELATQASSKSADRRCFIASVALRDYPERLPALRHVRDGLLQVPGGAWLVDQYYQQSPAIADYLDRHELWRQPVLWLLWSVSWLLSPL